MADNGYFGGKGGSGVFQTLINQIPLHSTYISAFAGHDYVLRNIRPAKRTIIIDLDPKPLEWWALQSSHLGESTDSPALAVTREIFQTDAVAWLHHFFKLDRWPLDIATLDPTPPPGDDLFSSTTTRDRATLDPKTGAVEHFVFLDPPYPVETRTSTARYQCDMLSRAEHERLIATVLRIPSPTMICSYPNALYDAAFRAWRSLDYFSTTRSGDQRRERIWMNYDQPAVLHDYRYVGDDKRAREKVRRRARNWTASLKRMSPECQGAILQAIRSEFGQG